MPAFVAPLVARCVAPRAGAAATLAALLLTTLLLAPLAGHAHKPSDSYLTLTAGPDQQVDVAWHVALRDLDGELMLDADEDGRLTWGEVRTRWDDIRRFVQPHLRLTVAGQACEPVTGSQMPRALATHTDGRYAVLRWSQRCTVPPGQAWRGVEMSYSLFTLTDPTHRGVVRWRSQAPGTPATELGVVVLGGSRHTHRQGWAPFGATPPSDAEHAASAITTAGAPAASAPDLTGTQEAAPPEDATVAEGRPSALQQVLRTVREGVDHIAVGTDHILFLVSLLLVSVWRREGAPVWWPAMGDWVARDGWRSAVVEVLRLVTAFTVAHSLTLALAAFGVLSPPSRWVESLIALSVLLAAIDNLWPILRAPRWAVVFGFGLVHGFGFAGAMQDLGLSSADLAWPLLGFNLGVELGQLMLVAVMLPVIFVLRRTAFYRHAVVLPGSVAIGLLALVWLLERSLDTVILGWGG